MWNAAWKKLPGSYYALHEDQLYESSNEWGIPDLLPQEFDLSDMPDDIQPLAWRAKPKGSGPILRHFNIDDYRFSSVFSNFGTAVNALKVPSVWGTCGLDFSTWSFYPKAMRLWNIYRNHWCNRALQEQGIRVIPNINFGALEDLDYVLPSIPMGQVVSLRAPARRATGKEVFYEGYRLMVDRIKPQAILWFGDISDECVDSVNKVQFPAGHWEAKRAEQGVK